MTDHELAYEIASRAPAKHPEPHAPEGGKGEDFDGMFRFEKVMKRA